MEDEQAEFRFLRTVKIGTFHIGSSAVDLLVTGVWNRIMIVDLGLLCFHAGRGARTVRGGDLFGLPVGETTRFNAFWGSGVLLGMVITMLFTRRWRPDQQVGTTMWGLGLLAIP